MQKINRKIEYALIALKHMYHKNPGELTTAKEISHDHKTPFDATSRVLQAMAQKGWLKSEQGPRGGYLLQKDIAKMSLLDLIESITGHVQISNCLSEDEDGCDIHAFCNILPSVQWINKQLENFYRSLSLFEVLETPGNRCPGHSGFQQQFMV